jgi:hypothetical protein
MEGEVVWRGKMRDCVLLLQEDRDDCERVIMVRDDTIGLGALSRVAFSCSRGLWGLWLAVGEP